jgi:hypothetical protein
MICKICGTDMGKDKLCPACSAVAVDGGKKWLFDMLSLVRAHEIRKGARGPMQDSPVVRCELPTSRQTKELIRSELLSRKFEPITGYEPDPKREEWQGPEDCPPCPYFCRIHYENWGMIVWSYELFNACRLMSSIELGHPTFCRFAEYRRILFRRFEL